MISLLFLVLAAAPGLPQDVNPALFPALDSHQTAEIELAGLSALYPGRVLREAPRAPDPGNRGRAPLVAQLPRGLTYLRVYDLSAAIPSLGARLPSPALIVDLRYVVGEAAAAEQFAGALARAGYGTPAMTAIGQIPQPARLLLNAPAATLNAPAPLVLLVNGQTAGPLEAWLAAFQATGNVVVVGRRTAGQSGEYDRADVGGMYIITGELQPAGGSVVGQGVAPNFAVEVSAEQDFRAYQQVERGQATPADLLRHDRPPTPPPGNGAAPANSAAAPPAAPPVELNDAILQRAVDVVAALQVLGRMPASGTVSTTRPPGEAGSTAPPAPPPGPN